MWPTPVANDDNKTPEAHLRMKARMPGGARTQPTSLQVVVQMWPTPMASDDGHKVTAASKQRNLIGVATQWNTPSANDWKGSFRPGQRRGQLSEQVECSRPVPETLTHGEPSSTSTRTSRPRLNPAFAAWLMGLPDWWTHPESINCAASAMASYRSRLRSLLDYYCRD